MSAKKDEGNSYGSILKSTSIFGGIQIYQILITLIRGKFVAMFLGVAGMGVNALFTSLAQTLTQFSSLGLNLAIVKEVATLKEDPKALAHASAVAARLVFITATAGALICFIFSPILSKITFASDKYTGQFMLLSLMIFFTIAGNGFLSMLQGMRELKRISVASLSGAASGLIFGVPLYYFLGTKGIVPAMICVALTTFICYILSTKISLKDLPKDIKLTWQSSSPIAKKLIMLGLILMTNELIGALVTYSTNLYIRYFGALENVGLFQAANSLTNQYAGVVFTAMLLDFFPRLSAAASDNVKMRNIVNRQLEIVSLIATPLMSLLILSSPLVIKLLLTDEFEAILPLMRWMGIGVLIKALMFPLGYIAFAKDNRKLFFWLEGVICNILTLFLNCLFYSLFDLIGLSYALIADCIICFAIYCIVNNKLYGYRLNKAALLHALGGVLICCCVFAASNIGNTLVSYSLMSIFTGFSLIFSFFNLHHRLHNEK